MISSRSTPPAGLDRKFQKKILLIDHEPGVTRLIRRALERAGKYLIREEHDDKLALNAARWFRSEVSKENTLDRSRTRRHSSHSASSGTRREVFNPRGAR